MSNAPGREEIRPLFTLIGFFASDQRPDKAIDGPGEEFGDDRLIVAVASAQGLDRRRLKPARVP